MFVLKRIAILSLLAGSASLLHAQATATASRSADAQIGIGYTYLSPDYSPAHFSGIAAYIDYDFLSHIGIEGEFHYAKSPASDPGSSQIYEKTYEIGGRYYTRLRKAERLSPYAKLLYGRGVFNFPYNVTTNSSGQQVATPTANLAYNIFAIGGGVDYTIKRHLNARADFEYQHWMGFPPNGLTPTMFTIGVAYRFQ